MTPFIKKEADTRDSLLGIKGAITLGLSTLIGGVVVAVFVQTGLGTVSGIALSGSGIATIVGTFLKGTKATWKSNEKKTEEKTE